MISRFFDRHMPLLRVMATLLCVMAMLQYICMSLLPMTNSSHKFHGNRAYVGVIHSFLTSIPNLYGRFLRSSKISSFFLGFQKCSTIFIGKACTVYTTLTLGSTGPIEIKKSRYCSHFLHKNTPNQNHKEHMYVLL